MGAAVDGVDETDDVTASFGVSASLQAVASRSDTPATAVAVYARLPAADPQSRT